jgi:ABC-type uncharacterized transport system permease subunit
MIAVLRDLPAYRQLADLRAQLWYAYRAQVVLEIISLVLQIYLLRMVWTAVYAGQAVAPSPDLQTLIAYLTLAQLQVWVIAPKLSWIIEERIRDGTIAIDLARPVPYLPQLLAQQVGDTAGSLPFIAAALPVVWLTGSLQPPASPQAAALYVVSLALAYAVAVLIGLAIGLIAFWTLEFSGFIVMYWSINAFFSGALVPLSFFPPWLRAVADLLPFQTQAYLPVSIYLGQMEGEAAWRALGVQAAWVVLLVAIVQVGWRRAMRRVVVQGG